MGIKINQLPDLVSVAGTDMFPADDSGGTTGKHTLAKVAEYAVNAFETTLGGISRTVKTAIDAIQTLLGSTSISGIGDGTVTGAISSLNSDLAQRSTSMTAYTPTIGWSNGASITVANVGFGYARIGNFLFISGRFNITDKGSPGNTSLTISLPSGYTPHANPAVGCFGNIVPFGTASITNLMVRASSTGISIYRGASGDYSSGVIVNGYYAMFALIPIA